MVDHQVAIERITADFKRWQELLDLIHVSFAYMQGVVDPPSSAFALDENALREKALSEIAFVALAKGELVGCMFCREENDALYVGKLAISPSCQGKGIGTRLLEMAMDLAREHNLPALELQTRIELVANHAYFESRGFVRSGEGAHAGYDRPTWIWMRKRLEARN